MKKLILVLAVAVAALPAFCQSKTLLNLDRKGAAIQGYDPVAFFTDNKPVKGSAEFSSTRDGATYHFASAEHQATFDKDPAKYEPCFGGYCAYGVSRDRGCADCTARTCRNPALSQRACTVPMPRP